MVKQIKAVLDSSWAMKIFVALLSCIAFLYGQAVFSRMDRQDSRSSARFDRIESKIDRALNTCITFDELCKVEDRLNTRINRLEDRTPFRAPGGGGG